MSAGRLATGIVTLGGVALALTVSVGVMIAARAAGVVGVAVLFLILVGAFLDD